MNPFENLPPPWPEDLQPANRSRAAGSGKTVVVLDDDPTGTQTVYGVPVFTSWDEGTLRPALAEAPPLVYILTNTRALPEPQAVAVTKEIVATLEKIAVPATLVSRSDSTLRGHYPAETNALDPQGKKPLLLIPFFEEGGRLTLGGTHYVVEHGVSTPASETPFARDPAFGYSSAYLPDYVEEKSGGRTRAKNVAVVPLSTIRQEGPSGVAEILSQLYAGAVCAIDAVAMRDLEVVAAAVALSGREFVYRTAASWVRALAGLPGRPPLSGAELAPPSSYGGLVVAGSYVPKTTAQLSHLTADTLELDVTGDLETQASEIAARADALIAAGKNAVVFTSRTHVGADDSNRGLDTGRHVSRALCNIVRSLAHRPRFLIAKGGITSSDLATEALGVKRADVLGQALPGVPAWRLGDETKFPGLTYIVFPGNVGDDLALANLVTKLSQP